MEYKKVLLDVVVEEVIGQCFLVGKGGFVVVLVIGDVVMVFNIIGMY